MKNGDKAAFARSDSFDSDGQVTYTGSIGLTKRELFAAMAMQGFAALPSDGPDYDDEADEAGDAVALETYRADRAEAAVAWADALLAALAKEPAQ